MAGKGETLDVVPRLLITGRRIAGSSFGGVKGRDQVPQLVLMDVVLPGMSGFQATRAMARDAAIKHIPVIIVSTKAMETDKAWGLRQGAADYIVKPPREDELIARINELVA